MNPDRPTTSRRAAREAAFRALYAIQVGGTGLAEALDPDLLGDRFAPEAAAFVRRLVEGAATDRQNLDGRFAPHLAPDWPVERLAVTDRLALEMASHELWSEPDIPPKVTIDEYVRLARTYGSAESAALVNAILAKVLPESPKKEGKALTDPPPPEEPTSTPEPGGDSEPEDGASLSTRWVIKSDR